MKRYILPVLAIVVALAMFAGVPDAQAAAPKLATYTAPNGDWSVDYPTTLHPEQLTPEITIFISKDRHTVAAVDVRTLAGSIKPSAMNARGQAALRAIYNKDVKNTGTLEMPGARWQTGFTFATDKGSVGAARYHQNGRIDGDYRVFGFLYGYKAKEEASALPMLEAMDESLRIQPPAAQRLGQARETLRAYLAALEAGRYDDADALYGGGYALLKNWNPDVPASNHIKLLSRGCNQNGLNCLALRRVVGETAISASEYNFVVELMNADGTLFVQEPCCGDTTGPTIARFPFTVKQVNGKLLVQDLPPYTP